MVEPRGVQPEMSAQHSLQQRKERFVKCTRSKKEIESKLLFSRIIGVVE